MPAKKKPTASERPDKASLMIRLTAEEQAALAAFIAAQRVAPDRSSVGRTALREFLTKEGHWPPK